MSYLRNRGGNLKKAIAIIFIAVLYFGFFVPKSKAVGIVDATLLFNPASTSVSAGSDFNLVARVNPGSNTVDGDGVNAVQVDITFDPDVLQLNSMVAAGTFARLATPTIDNVLGTASATFFIAGDDVITVSDVATLSFHAQTTATDSPVAFANSANAAVSDGLGTQVVATRTPAAVTVTGVSYTVGGTASGLSGTAVLQNNAGNNLSVTANTTFTFTNGLADGATYAVTILTQPTGQTCVLSNATGTISAANVDDVGLACTTDTYTVTFNGNTSDGGSTATQTLDYNTPTALTANGYTKTGYTFDGWNTLANGTGTDYADGADYTIGTANVTLYAQWTVNTYTVTFDGNTSDGGSTATQTLDYNTPTALTTNGYTKTGYSFDGWNTLANGTGTDYADGADYTIGTANVTLYAQWIVATYTVTYDGNSNTGGTAPADQTKTYAVDLTLQTNSGTLIRTNYTFDGWNTQADGGGTDYAVGASYTTNAALTLYAKWTIDTYTVTFDGNTSDGGSTATQTLDYNTPTALTTNGYTKTGYSFDGWNTLANGTGTDYADGADYTIGTANVTLYAQWTIITYTIGGTASGLNGTAVLQNNGGDDLNVTADGTFTFATGLTNGATYAVTIETQPIGQTCVLSNATGTISAANVTNVGLSCTDIEGPTRSAGAPTGRLSSSTKSKTISLSTNENATCRFSTSSGTVYDSMTTTFDGAGTTAHTYLISGLSKGRDYLYYVRCQNEDLVVNTDDYTVSFSVKSSKKKEEKKTQREISVSKKRIKRGEVLVESGKRFTDNSYVALYFGKYGGGYYNPMVVKTDADGKFSVSYKIPPSKPFGTYRWYAVDLKNKKRSKTSYFSVKP